MNIGDIPIPSSWKALIVKAVLVLILLAGCLFGWREYVRIRSEVADTVAALTERQTQIEQKYQALQVRVEESSKRTERRLEAVAKQAQEYARDSDIDVLVSDLNAELERWRRDQAQPGD